MNLLQGDRDVDPYDRFETLDALIQVEQRAPTGSAAWRWRSGT